MRQSQDTLFSSSSLPAAPSFQFRASRPFLGMVPRKSLCCCCCPDQVSGSVNNRQESGDGTGSLWKEEQLNQMDSSCAQGPVCSCPGSEEHPAVDLSSKPFLGPQ